MRKFFKKRLKLIIITLLIVAVGVSAYYFIWGKKITAAAKVQEYTARMKKMDVTISGSGSVVSTSRQDVSSEVQGTILKVFHSEGDKVKIGDTLFQLDDATAASSVERTKNSIRQAENSVNTAKQNIAYLKVTTPISGQVSNIQVNVGDNINKGQEICTVTNTGDLKLIVPFNGSQIENIYVGEAANVFLQDYMDSVSGTVTYVSNAGQVVSGGGSLYNVEISIKNPGSLMNGAKASAQIGGQYSVNSGTVQYANSQKVRAQVSGTVQSININEQQQIGANQLVVNITNDDLTTQLENAQTNLKDLQMQMDSQVKTQNNYKITSVIDGTITSQTAKVGDVVSTNSSSTLAVITNPDQMQFDISVDELDIAKVEVGMTATVTLDALPNQNFDAYVSAVSGTGSSSNGVTTYPVTVVIKNPTGIKEGMNANADIIVQHKDNALTLPIEAVQKMGSRYFVFIKSVGGTSSSNASSTVEQGNTEQNTRQWSGQRDSQYRTSTNGSSQSQYNRQSSSETNSGQSQTQQRENTTQSQSQNTSTSQSKGTNSTSSSNSKTAANSRQQSMLKKLGEGVTMRMVEVGINNDSDIEIVSGLSEGDTVVVPVTTTTTTSSTQQSGSIFGGMGGAMGGPPSGEYQRRSSSSGSSSSSSSSSSSKSSGSSGGGKFGG